MNTTPVSAKRRTGEVERIRKAAVKIADDLRDLGTRVEELSEAIAALGSEPVEKKVASTRISGSASSRPVDRQFRVTVRPLPELAMAAVAETALRGLPGVKQILEVERKDDWASFLLEVSNDADLISEMRVALPVSFTVSDQKQDEVSLDLQWLWGADSI